MANQRGESCRYYFVDEAGDATLFGSNGRSIIGQPGCSWCFMLGLLDVRDVAALGVDLEALRASLLADTYFRDVPSMQPSARKTALRFHATDDVPEVRKQVFECLSRHELRFHAVVRDKRSVLEYVRQRNDSDPGYRYSQNELYDSLVRRLLRNLLHKHDEYHISFARRGKSDRTRALREALEAARARFDVKFGIASDAPMGIASAFPQSAGGLQAVDYFLWALQRLYEKREDRYVSYLWPLFSMVHDVDDTRQAKYGTYYTKRKPLTAAALGLQPGI